MTFHPEMNKIRHDHSHDWYLKGYTRSDNTVVDGHDSNNRLKGLAQDKIIKKSVILLWILNMTI